jgi:hypothetical protein
MEDRDPVPLSSDRTNWLVIAAGLLLLLVSAGIGYHFYQKNQQLQSEITALRTQTQRQEGLVRQILNDPNYQSLALKGNEKLPLKMPKAEIRVFWNAQTMQVYVSVAQLPELEVDQQYQLWALKNDQPIDAGVFQVRAAGVVQSLKTITAADKWAVTVEPKGGSPQPHLDKLCLLSAR